MSDDSTPPAVLTQAAYARLHNVSRQAVSKWAATGKIVLTPEGLVDVARSDLRLRETTNQVRGGKGGKVSAAAVAEARAAGASVPLTPAGSSGAGPTAPKSPAGPDGMSFARANTAKVIMQAKMLEQDYQERSGRLIARNLYDKALADALVPMMAKLETLAPRIGSRCAAETDVRKIQALIDDEIDAIRDEIESRISTLIVVGHETRQ